MKTVRHGKRARHLQRLEADVQQVFVRFKSFLRPVDAAVAEIILGRVGPHLDEVVLRFIELEGFVRPLVSDRQRSLGVFGTIQPCELRQRLRHFGDDRGGDSS